MQYWDLVMLSFRIAWRHKYLWLFAFFSGEAGGGFSYSPSTSPPTSVRPGRPNFRVLGRAIRYVDTKRRKVRFTQHCQGAPAEPAHMHYLFAS